MRQLTLSLLSHATYRAAAPEHRKVIEDAIERLMHAAIDTPPTLRRMEMDGVVIYYVKVEAVFVIDIHFLQQVPTRAERVEVSRWIEITELADRR